MYRPTTTEITVHCSELWKYEVGETWPHRGERLPVVGTKTYAGSEWCTVFLKNKEVSDAEP